MLGRILIVNKNSELAVSARRLLNGKAKLVHSVKRPNRIPSLMASNRYDVVLLDEEVLSKDGVDDFYWIQHILLADSNVTIVVTSRLENLSNVVGAIKAGAFEVLPMPWPSDLPDLIEVISERSRIQRSRELARRAGGRPSASQTDVDVEEFIGYSEALGEVHAQIEKVAATDANVLILGENGTGKELVARALHRKSLRDGKPFVSVDMGAVTESLFESELFGHKKGSFTDAIQDREGRFEAASKGTLFLDEIGNLPVPLQAKLLTVLQHRTVTRIGTNSPRPIDVRLICATNQPIYESVFEGQFRQDLLYRINTVEIYLPPLRERIEDIRPLTDFFLAFYAEKYKPQVDRISAAALRKLEKYPWPGNVRELKHMVERAVIMTDTTALQPEDFRLQSIPSSNSHSLMFDTLDLETVEKRVIQTAMDKHGGIVSQAASELGLTRTTLYRRLEKHGL